MMEGVTRVTDLKVEQVMVARAQMVTVDVSQALDDILPVMISSAHSRFPVTDGDRDTIIGILFCERCSAAHAGKRYRSFALGALAQSSRVHT